MTETLSRRARAKAMLRRNPRKAGMGLLVPALVVAQMLWDISANDLAAYFQPIFTRLFGAPPTP